MKTSQRSRLLVVSMALLLAGCSSEKPASPDPPVPPASAPSGDPAAATAQPQTPSSEPADAAEDRGEDDTPGPAAAEPAAGDAPAPMSLQQSLENELSPLPGDAMLAELGYVSPSDQVRSRLADPPGATRLSQQSSLWIDLRGKRVFVDGYIAQREAYLEMFACPAETKEHESIVGVIAQSSEVHAALLAVGAMPGTPVRWDTEYVPATGQPIRVWVMWHDEQGQFQSTDARQWIRHVGTEDSLELDWVFVGSSIWRDPSDGREYYQANGGEMICVSNFSTAMMDLPVQSSDQNNALLFDAFTERIPPVGTPVRLILVPLPDPAAQSNESPTAADASLPATPASDAAPPTADLLPLKPTAQQ